jgi:hypothetical protein
MPIFSGSVVQSRPPIWSDVLVADRPVRPPFIVSVGGVIRKVQFTGRLEFGSAGLALLCHCSEEMNHLATFLPELYERFGAGDAPA